MERIIEKIVKDNIDVDKLLVVTFTNAAASEMRERILDAIYKKIDEFPDDENLQKQVILLGKSNICTIHSFCLEVIKNNFFETDLQANFRIASEEEMELLKQETLEDVFEELYENEDKQFEKLIETYTGYRGDEPVKELVFNIYRMIESAPFPEKWLEEKIEMFHPNKYNGLDFSESLWGKIILENFKEEIFDSINHLKIQKNKLDKYPEMEKYSLIIQDDIISLQKLYESKTWDEAFDISVNLKFKTWPADKKITSELKDEIKKQRDNIKKKITDLLNKTLLYNSEDAYNDIYLVYDNLVALKNLILKFIVELKKNKRNKNIIDFTDIEHYALQILVKQENGKIIPTDVAKKYQEKFEEIAIDEYQDSNQIQELILKSVSRGNNIFMVGDVKQSIYKFRQACPELFLEKYENYSFDGNSEGLKIQLFKNFRSNQNILDITNSIFENIMSKSLGDIDYTEEEYLNLGANYEWLEDGVGKSELHIIDVNKKDDENTEIDDEEVEENGKELSKIELEAVFVSQKIQELIKNNTLIKSKDGNYRRIEYRDIVILLRSTKAAAPIFEKELIKNNIPVFSDTTSEYLDTIEVQTIINLLKLLDNPLNDIRLVSVMRSPIGGFTDNEILEIRLENRDESVYSNLLNIRNSKTSVLQEKVEEFLRNLETWQKASEYLNLAELIWKIYIDTGFLNYVGLMPNGLLRQANLRMLFERAKEYEKTSFSGLFNFIRFTEKLKSGNSDMSAAKIIGENENVVRIMSIHKSKGLEFPVVFLSGSSKKINLQDLKTNLLLHKDIGFGPEYIDYERKIQYPTAAKQAIKIVSRNEAISEEMRILYVALTRAKEKLIITGTVNNIEKEEENKKEILQIYNSDKNRLNPVLLKKYISYFDWIHLVYLSGKLNDNLDIIIHKKEEFFLSQELEEEQKTLDFCEKVDFEKIDRFFNWEYQDKNMINLPVKTTVSQIKSMKNEENKIGLEEITSKFAEVNHKVTATRMGTIIHLILQKLDFRKKYTKQEIEDYINNLQIKKIITEEEAKNIDIKIIENFTNSEIYSRIKEAKIIEKEKAFCVNEKLEEYKMQETLIQGIIDLYFIDKNNKLVLIDYKTDFVKNENELKNRYLIQLQIYKKALEVSLNRVLDEMYIYSTHLNKLILI